MLLHLRACCIAGSLILSLNCTAQDQNLADSLIKLYTSENYGGEEITILKNIATNETNPDLKIKYAELLIEKASPDSLFSFLHSGFLQKGNALRVKGDLAQALESYLKSSYYAGRSGDDVGINKITISIADTYSEIGNSRNAEIYYNKGIQLLRKSNDSISLATALLNAGDEYFNSGKYDSAILFFQESGPIFKKLNHMIGTAYTLGNMGMVYAERGEDLRAEAMINEAIAILEELRDYYPISIYLMYMSDIYVRQQNINTALAYAQRSLNLAQLYGMKDQIGEANLKLAELYEKIGDTKSSYRHYKNHVTYRDSVKNLQSVQQMADLRTNFEVAQKQVEVDLLNQQKRNQQIIALSTVIALVLICLLAFALYRRYRFIQLTNKIIEEEKNKSDSLLLNILPEETARELKETGRVKAKKFESATVLFTDFKDFTKSAEHVEPERLVKSLDFYFKAFDEIITKHGLEKIKTIGDSYMCAGGLPSGNTTHARDVVRAASEMIKTVNDKSILDNELIQFEVRIGVHTGPVVAGIVGNKKWQYDIWGDTVNIASRLESTSEMDKVNLSESTYLLIKDEFACEYRGEIDVKNHGSLKMYFLTG